MQAITTIGLGIARSVFQIQGRSASTLPRQPRRAEFLAYWGAGERRAAVLSQQSSTPSSVG
jgi:hypothetical protein